MKSVVRDNHPIRGHELWSMDIDYELLCVDWREVMNQPDRVLLIGIFLARRVT